MLIQNTDRKNRIASLKAKLNGSVEIKSEPPKQIKVKVEKPKKLKKKNG